eukprot:scaffold20528_cov106-Cylindrotheca_fusiformis.AAC.2
MREKKGASAVEVLRKGVEAKGWLRFSDKGNSLLNIGPKPFLSSRKQDETRCLTLSCQFH